MSLMERIAIAGICLGIIAAAVVIVFTAPYVFTVPFGSVAANVVTFEAAAVQIRRM